MTELIDITLLITACCDQVQLAQRLSPDLRPLELLDRVAASIGCLLPRLPDAVLELAMQEALRRMEGSLA